MSTIGDIVDSFNSFGHKLGNSLVAMFDRWNGVPSEKEVTLEEVLKDDKSHRMSLNELEESSIEEMEFHHIHNEELEFSQGNPMTNNLVKSPKMDNNVPKDNTLSAEISFFEMMTILFGTVGMSFDFDSLYCDCYAFAIDTLHWKLEVRLSRHCQPQWFFIVKNHWFLTYSQIVEDSTIPMFDPPRVVEHHIDSKSYTLLSDEITEFVKELESIYDSTIQIPKDLQKSRQKLKDALKKADAIFNEIDFSNPQSPEKVIEQPKNVLSPDLRESNNLIGLWRSWMKLYSILFHSQKCGLLWVKKEILSQELLAGQLTGFYQSLRGLFRQILSSHLLSGQLCCLKKVRGLFHQILSSDLLSGQLCYLKKVRGLLWQILFL
jgi:hypothetical protein